MEIRSNKFVKARINELQIGKLGVRERQIVALMEGAGKAKLWDVAGDDFQLHAIHDKKGSIGDLIYKN